MRRKLRKLVTVLAVLLAVLLTGPAWMIASGQVRFDGNWRTADMSSTGTAPEPFRHPEAIVQVYSARAFNWRAAFGVHTWIAIKHRHAGSFDVHEVIGWRRWQELPVLSNSQRPADGLWFDAEPELLLDIRGAQAERLIPKIEAAIDRYPWPETYTLWPGPNSNTFTAFVSREVPELGLDLPPTAIGKDYIPGNVFARAPSGTGFQFNILGVLGVLGAPEEGLEFNLMSLSLGLDLRDPALRLPGIGRLDFSHQLALPAPAQAGGD